MSMEAAAWSLQQDLCDCQTCLCKQCLAHEATVGGAGRIGAQNLQNHLLRRACCQAVG